MTHISKLIQFGGYDEEGPPRPGGTRSGKQSGSKIFLFFSFSLKFGIYFG